MYRYEPTLHRAAFGFAAVAMSAITLGLAVFLPASVNSERYASAQLAASTAAVAAPIEVAIIPARIDVVGECDPALAVEPVRQAQRNVDQSS